MVGGGHNGLTAAAYLARAGKRVLVCERRDRLGGAATLERPFSDQRFVVSPCAYLVGLLDERRDLRARARAPRLLGHPGRPEPLVPVRRRQLLRRLPRRAAHEEYLLAQGFTDARHRRVVRVRRRLRPDPRSAASRRGRRHLALAVARPRADRASARRRRGADRDRVRGVDRLDARAATSTTSGCAMRSAARGRSGPSLGPQDPGTAAIRLMHHQGDLLGLGSVWGYVEGGLGRASFAIADAALEAGATLAAGLPVGRDRPGRGGRARVAASGSRRRS